MATASSKPTIPHEPPSAPVASFTPREATVSPGVRACVAATLATASVACGGLAHIERDPTRAARVTSLGASLRGRPIELHLAVPPVPLDNAVLVLYASGDGGWFGAAVDMFRAIGDAGFYAVGVSSRSLLHHETAGGHAPGIGDLAEDYQTVLDQAGEALHLPQDRRVVLSGWSRGASLAVLVGGAHHSPRHLAGVVAIGLAAEENLNLRDDSDEDPIDTPGAVTGVAPAVVSAAGGTLDVYALLAGVAPHRCAVIQSSGDGYLPAAQARARFGADTAIRRFFEVRASNHRFAGAGPTFVERLGEALRWASADAANGAN
jgi:hypothetical protein